MIKVAELSFIADFGGVVAVVVALLPVMVEYQLNVTFAFVAKNAAASKAEYQQTLL